MDAAEIVTDFFGKDVSSPMEAVNLYKQIRGGNPPLK